MSHNHPHTTPGPERPLTFSGEATHGGDVWGAARRLGVPPSQVLDLSASLNPLGPPPGLRQELDAAFDSICHYPDRQALELRRALAQRLGVEVINVLPGNGSTALIRLVIRVMDLHPIVVMAPAFGEIPRSLALSSRHFHYIFLQEKESFTPTDHDLQRLWEMEPSCVFITNPGSPGGACWDLGRLEQLLAQAQRRRCWVVLDEAFVDFTPGDYAAWSPSKVLEYPRLIVLRSMTKIYCMAGLRLGYLLAHREAVPTLSMLGEPWSVNTLAQRAGVFCLQQSQYLDETHRRVAAWRDSMVQQTSAMGLSVMPSQVNYLLTRLPRSGPTAAEVAAFCAAEGVLLRDCSSFAGCDEYHLRLAVCRPADQKRLFTVLGQALEQS